MIVIRVCRFCRVCYFDLFSQLCNMLSMGVPSLQAVVSS